MKHSIVLLTLLGAAVCARAELKLPAVFGDHMVLQQGQANRVWGWDTPGTKVTVKFGGQAKSADAGADGRWELSLEPLQASSDPATMEIKGSNARTLKDILVGEVWICSGQSNMRWTLQNSWDSDLEIPAAKHPKIRLMNIPNVGTQDPQQDVDAAWEVCSPANAGAFSGVGYFFGLRLHQMLDVPVGLINNAWGGSAAEAWVRRDVLEGDARFSRLIADWRQREEQLQSQEAVDRHEKLMEGWNGVLLPTIGYGIRGVIWYQGESNATRAWEYRALFPLMIQHWRQQWGQGDFPFYWVQLADFKDEKDQPGDSDWAELREAQTLTQTAVPNGGQAVIIDLGESNDIHPKNKRDVGARLARIALARDYGMDIRWRSPELASVSFADGKALVTIDTFGSTLRTVDTTPVTGFAVCGEDRQWVWAEAKIVGRNRNQVEVSAAAVPNPVAVRYAWADNPVCNLYSAEGLPVTPFRSDDFEMITAPKEGE
jgi:sialate O-acetylesterase